MNYFENVKKDFLRMLNDTDFSRTFVIDGEREIPLTYGEIFFLSIDMADWVDRSEKSILAIMDNSIELLCLLLAVSLTDYKIACVDPRKGKDEIQKIIDENLDKRIVRHDVNDRLFIGKSILDVKETDIDIEFVKQEAIRRYSKKDFLAPYLITYTSGTSGKTKGVIHSIGTLLASAYALNKCVPVTNAQRLYHMMPMTYMAGILNSIYYPLIGGASIVVAKRFEVSNASSFWKNVNKYNADLFWVSPSMLKMIIMLDRSDIGFNYCQERSVTFLVGTSALSESLRKEFNNKYMINILAGYGLSETLFTSMETYESIDTRGAGSVGKFLEGVDYKINEDGELEILVPWMYLGYTNEDRADYFDKDYYKSGDLVSVQDNQLYITGRKKDLIIKGGMNISPKLIEDCIIANFKVSDCAVFPVDDNGEEKVCCAYVSEFQDTDYLEKSIRKVIYEKLGRNYSIDFFWKMDEMIRNLNGKIDKIRMGREWGTKGID